jgi:hypothetical protein
MQIRAAAHPIESFLIFLTKFVLLGQKYIWLEDRPPLPPTAPIYPPFFYAAALIFMSLARAYRNYYYNLSNSVLPDHEPLWDFAPLKTANEHENKFMI